MDKLNITPFDNTLKIDASIIKSLDYMLKYQNYQLLEMLGKSI